MESGGRGKWKGGKGRAPKLLLNQGPSEPCYATDSTFNLRRGTYDKSKRQDAFNSAQEAEPAPLLHLCIKVLLSRPIVRVSCRLFLTAVSLTRRLATANRSRANIRVPKIVGQERKHGRFTNILLSSSLMQNLVAVCHTAWAKNIWGSPPPAL